ncbi:shikimate kinase [Candidatus Puniceispirillum sp.]|nr:shikimate kinase [Candidatus Puniceispirillum sp.]
MKNLHKTPTHLTNNVKKLVVKILSTLDRPIILVGLMGSGKSAVGRRTAKLLGVKFTDSDQIIVKEAGISIAEIFEFSGEKKFRDIELKTLTNLICPALQVIATGGGAFCQKETANLLLERSHVVWLKAPPKTLLSRIGNFKSRPLLDNDHPLTTLTELNHKRQKYYQKAQIHLDTDGLSAPQAAEALLHALDTHLATH